MLPPPPLEPIYDFAAPKRVAQNHLSWVRVTPVLKKKNRTAFNSTRQKIRENM